MRHETSCRVTCNSILPNKKAANGNDGSLAANCKHRGVEIYIYAAFLELAMEDHAKHLRSTQFDAVLLRGVSALRRIVGNFPDDQKDGMLFAAAEGALKGVFTLIGRQCEAQISREPLKRVAETAPLLALIPELIVAFQESHFPLISVVELDQLEVDEIVVALSSAYHMSLHVNMACMEAHSSDFYTRRYRGKTSLALH